MLMQTRVIQLRDELHGIMIRLSGRRNNKFEYNKIWELCEELRVEIFHVKDNFSSRDIFIKGEREKLSFLLFLLQQREEQLAEMEVMYSI